MIMTRSQHIYLGNSRAVQRYMVFISLHQKWIFSSLQISKYVANMIFASRSTWLRPYVPTNVSKYGLHHICSRFAIIFTTSLPIRKFEQIHFFVQCFLIEIDWLGKGKLRPHGCHRVMIFID